MGNIYVGEQIKNLRISKKMTLSVFAERIGVTISSVSAYENGTRFPSYDVLVKISKTFNITTDTLLGCSSNDMIDISGLNKDQRVMIEESIKYYKAFNEVIENVINHENYNIYSDILIKYNLNKNFENSNNNDFLEEDDSLDENKEEPKFLNQLSEIDKKLYRQLNDDDKYYCLRLNDKDRLEFIKKCIKKDSQD